MSIAQTVPSVISAQVPPVPSTGDLPTEAQLQQAYLELRQAIRLSLKRGLEFGRMCYQWREHYKSRGSHKSKGFKPFLDKLNISRTTAYRWIASYEDSQNEEGQLSTTRYKVATRTPKVRNLKQRNDSQEMSFNFDLPRDYTKEQWTDDVKAIGGQKKVGELFVSTVIPLVKQQADAKRKKKEHNSGKPH